MNSSNLKNKIFKLPQTSGVYVFYGKNRKVLYVGKATNLRSRVGSYFSARNTNDTNLMQIREYANRPIEMMIDQVSDVKIQKTETVLEALILESHLIKKLQPKYNAMGKDDKSFCYYAVTREDFPRILIVRATDIAQISNSQFLISKKIPNSKIQIQKIYGPYISKKQMEIVLKILRKIFPFHSLSQKTEKGCLDFQIGRCPGPYAGAISKADYLKNIRGIKMILEGKKKSLIKKLEKEMKEYAKNSEFEKAAEARNKVFALNHIRGVALIIKESELQVTGYRLQNLRIEAYDISNISGQYAVGSMVVFKDSEPDKSQYRKFRIKTIKGNDDVGMMREVLVRRFKNDWLKPDLIMIDGGLGHLNMAVSILESLGLKINIISVAKGIGRNKLDLRFKIYDLRSELKNISNNNHLIKQIMDEAHRFAISYHRKLRQKSLLTQ